MHSTPYKLTVYDKAFYERRKMEDAKAHIESYYIFEGVSLAFSNAFRKKGHKPKDYFEVFKKPVLQIIEEADENKAAEAMTEEEKKRKTEQFFMNLQIQMANYNLAKGKKDGTGS